MAKHTTPTSTKSPAPRQRRRKAARPSKAAAPSLPRIDRAVSAEPRPPVAPTARASARKPPRPTSKDDVIDFGSQPPPPASPEEQARIDTLDAAEAPESAPLSDGARATWEQFEQFLLVVLAVVGAAGAEMQELMVMWTERYTGPALRGVKGGKGTLLWIAMNRLERDGEVVVLHNRKTYKAQCWLVEYAPKDPDVIAIATGDKDMEPVASWRARQSAQRAEYKALAEEHKTHSIDLNKTSMEALLLHGLGFGGDDPVYDLLSSMLHDLEAMHALINPSDCNPIADKLYLLARQIEVARELSRRSGRGEP